VTGKHRTPIDSKRFAATVARAGEASRLDSEAAPVDGALLEGGFLVETLAARLRVHASDAVERTTLNAYIELPPALTVSLLLNGRVRARLGDLPLELAADDGAVGHVWRHEQPAVLQRHVEAGERVRKVHVALPADWLPDGAAVQRHPVPELELLSWSPSRRAIRCAEDILALGEPRGELDRLRVLSWAIEIMSDALPQILSPGRQTAASGGLSERDLDRARRVRAVIESLAGGTVTLDAIAARCDMSVSTLQRIFRRAFGCTVMEFARRCRLEQARRALSRGESTVSEAAFDAGYSCPSNFATAFGREFGYPPSSCRGETAGRWSARDEDG
jgi:AraC-like DNA-binding protein